MCIRDRSGCAHQRLGLFPGGQVAPLVADLGQRMGALHPDREGPVTTLDEPGPLLAPDPQLLGQIVGDISRWGRSRGLGGRNGGHPARVPRAARWSGPRTAYRRGYAVPLTSRGGPGLGRRQGAGLACLYG